MMPRFNQKTNDLITAEILNMKSLQGKCVMFARFGLGANDRPHTIRECCDSFHNMTPMRVRAWEAKIMRKVRAKLN